MSEIVESTLQNSSFSKLVPGLQIAVDSTSLGEFKTCERKYYLGIVLGWRQRAESVHLQFGIWVHEARELYDALRARGASHDNSLDTTMDSLLRATWNKQLRRPWLSDHKEKNRLSLLRTVVWYLDGLAKEDSLKTVLRKDGSPMVELSFRFDSRYVSRSQEGILLCGHLDRIAEMNEEYFISDIKTTTRQLSPQFFEQFTPGNQFSMYAVAGRVGFGFPIKSLVVDAIQIGVTFSRFQRGLVSRSEEFLIEWLDEVTQVWLPRMEEAALAQRWVANDKVCDMYGGCPFRAVCARPPSARQQWLRSNFIKKIWDPLQIRGDI